MSNPPIVPTLQVKDELNEILGIALFDGAGLPLQSFSTREQPGRTWVQVAFQSLGLYSMLPKLIAPLRSAAAVPDLIKIVCIQERQRAIVILPYPQGFAALLVAQTHNDALDTFLNWVQNIEIERLIQHPRFQGF